jgi:hypothetical protein
MLKFPCKNAFGALALGGKSWQAVLKSKGELGPIHPSWLLCYDKIQGIIGKPVSAPTFDELMQMETDPMFRSAVESRRVALDLQLVRAPPRDTAHGNEKKKRKTSSKVTASGRASKQKTSLRSFALTKKEKEETRLQCKKCRLEGRTGPETHKHRGPTAPTMSTSSTCGRRT